MTLPDFTAALELEPGFRPVVFGRRDLETWAADVWPLVEEDHNPGRWACRFVVDRQEAAEVR